MLNLSKLITIIIIVNAAIFNRLQNKNAILNRSSGWHKLFYLNHFHFVSAYLSISYQTYNLIIN